MKNLRKLGIVLALFFLAFVAATICEAKTIKSPTKKELKEKLKKSTAKKILSFHYDDYDKNGEYEAFAVVGKEEPGEWDENIIYGDVWYINKNGTKRLIKDTRLKKGSGKTMDFGKIKYFKIDKHFTIESLSMVWQVKGKEVFEPIVSGKGMNIRKIKGTNKALITTHGRDYWNGFQVYYLYADKNGVVKEYGGLKITKKQLLKCKGAKEILDTIQKKGGKITEILYRSNGIIHINYTSEEAIGDSVGVELKLKEKTVKLVDGENFSVEAYYKAFIPEIATYPKKFPIK